jgi:hypothetical protein
VTRGTESPVILFAKPGCKVSLPAALLDDSVRDLLGKPHDQHHSRKDKPAGADAPRPSKQPDGRPHGGERNGGNVAGCQLT